MVTPQRESLLNQGETLRMHETFIKGIGRSTTLPVYDTDQSICEITFFMIIIFKSSGNKMTLFDIKFNRDEKLSQHRANVFFTITIGALEYPEQFAYDNKIYKARVFFCATFFNQTGSSPRLLWFISSTLTGFLGAGSIPLSSVMLAVAGNSSTRPLSPKMNSTLSPVFNCSWSRISLGIVICPLDVNVEYTGIAFLLLPYYKVRKHGAND